MFESECGESDMVELDVFGYGGGDLLYVGGWDDGGGGVLGLGLLLAE